MTLGKFAKIFLRVLLAVFLLLILLWGFIQTEWGQNWLAHQVTARLSKDLRTKISIKHISIGFFNKLEMNGFLLEDQKNDTLLYAGDLRVRITDWFFLQDKAVLKYVGLSDAVIKTNRKDSVWNYAFLDEYFESSSSDTTTKEKKPSGIQFDLKTIEMNNVHFINRDAWAGSDMEVMLGKLNLQAEEISISRKRVAISSIDLDRPYFSILNNKGNRPDTLDHSTSDTSRSTEPTWNFTFKDVQIKNGRFRNDKDSMVATV
ncbi:MAG TPA: hypothetical protein VNS32_05565, partial [Flavisolibacter sp.]|nr:hypothetical protein [Flavisolibacter sp.]